MIEEKKQVEEEVEEKPTEGEGNQPAEQTAEQPKPQEAENQPAETHAAEEGNAEQTAMPEQVPNQPAEQPQEQEAQAQEPAKQPRMFTQEQVNELVGKARAEGRERGYRQAQDEIRTKYGVESDDELDGIFADGSRFGEMRARNEDSESRYRNAMAELALVKSGILPSRQSDVRAILAANGLDITEENIATMIATHPEWVKQTLEESLETGGASSSPIPQPKPAEQQPEEQANKPLGLEPQGAKRDGEEDEKERVMKNLFRL